MVWSHTITREHNNNNMEKQFINAMRSIDWQPAIDIRNVGYLKDSVDPDVGWWDTAIKYFPDLPLDGKILDIGTWFGVFPRILKEIGYTDVECTECAAHNTGVRDDLEKLHQLFNIHPFEFEVSPGKEFSLPKTYDLITILHTNMHWQIHDLYCIKKGNDIEPTITKEWQVVDSTGLTHTFFVPWKTTEWQTFIDSIKNQLNPGGVCIMQPHPWPYETEPEVTELLAPYIKEHSVEHSILCITKD